MLRDGKLLDGRAQDLVRLVAQGAGLVAKLDPMLTIDDDDLVGRVLDQ